MKKIKVLTPFDEEAEYIMIEDLADLLLYHERIYNNRISRQLGIMIKSGYNSHCYDEGSLVGMVAQTTDGGIFELANKLDITIAGMLSNQIRDMNNGKTIIFNQVGGYCFLTDDYTILSESECNLTPDSYELREGSNYLNLENDPKLELWTITKVGLDNLSYVTNLRDFTSEELEEIMVRFVDMGGTTLLQYTTGIDADQMSEYINLAFASGISKVEIFLNMKNESLDKFIQDHSHLENLSFKYV